MFSFSKKKDNIEENKKNTNTSMNIPKNDNKMFSENLPPPKFGDFEKMMGQSDIESSNFEKQQLKIQEEEQTAKETDQDGVQITQTGESTEDENVSFEIPDFTEEDINLNVDLGELKSENDKEDEPIKKLEEITPMKEEEQEEQENFFEQEEEINKSEDSEIEEEEKEEEDLPKFDSYEEETDELKEFKEEDILSPKFLSKITYKQIIVNLLDLEKVIENINIYSKDFYETENDLKNDDKYFDKNIELIKTKIIEIDKKLFI